MADPLNSTHGYVLILTEEAEDADILLLNTCSIHEKVLEKVFALLGRWRKLKEANPDVIIGVCGCVASQEGTLYMILCKCLFRGGRSGGHRTR
ncbi:hypothetical protein ACZ87_03780 [Candidatus Erwinia dacicola]|uniref:MTTase N-terminal domain-containing protein n=1 Tax=Candidatus Erwinia dacicola TaxID=252393 RepID=A0A328TKB6_9GAMM|nr:hypothetical protein ACZ87_03780 [Candidatus Erwinia dacicola]